MRSTKLVRQLLTKYDLYSVPYISIHIQYVNKIGTEKHFILLLIMISMEVINNMTLHEKTNYLYFDYVNNCLYCANIGKPSRQSTAQVREHPVSQRKDF